MNKSDETMYLGRVISLLARHGQLSFGEIKNKTWYFLRKRRQTDSSIFQVLELFVEQGMLARKMHKSRIYYTLGNIQQTAPKISKLDLVEAGVDTENELMKKMINQAKAYVGTKSTNPDRDKALEYKQKAPPPSGVEGFK
jgi:hypothetical protein